jgi:pimeloyl-ACP methyl ester carboxylesterase
MALGCGSATPGFVPMDDDLRARGQASGVLRRRPAATRFWPTDRWRAATLKATVGPAVTDRVGEATIVSREVTLTSEPMPGATEQIHGIFVAPDTARRPRGPTVGSPRRPRGPVADDRASRPALLWVHDLGQTAPVTTAKEWAARDYAVLALDLPGRGPGRDASRSTGPDFTEEAIFKVAPAPTESYLFHAVAAVARGMQWLREQNGANASGIALVGDGWGAVIARLAAIADDRARALVLLYAAGGIDRGTAGERLRALPDQERALWRSRFDPNAYAADDGPPALFVTATGSKEYPLGAFVESVRAYRGQQALALAPNATRDLDKETTAAIRTWLDTTLRGATPSPIPRTVREEKDAVVVETTGRTPARGVSVYVADQRPTTNDQRPVTSDGWAGREWREVKATRVDERRWRAPLTRDKDGRLPLYFARVFDARGAALAALPPAARAPSAARGR